MLFVAEIGINHNGDLELAKQMIKEIKEAGADVVKFQKRNPDICVPDWEKDKLRETPWGTMTYLEYRKRIEFGKQEYDEIDKLCKEIGIKWTASVWDLDSLDFLLQYDIPYIKIPSALITDTALLKKAKESRKPIVMSIGMSTEEEVDMALSVLQDCDLTILQCNSAYPSKDDEIDLNVINRLIKTCDAKIGYSGHEVDTLPTIMAATLGAEMIERHVTIDKNMWGSDHKASLTINELRELIKQLKRIPIILGGANIQCYPSEEKAKQRLRRI